MLLGLDAYTVPYSKSVPHVLSKIKTTKNRIYYETFELGMRVDIKLKGQKSWNNRFDHKRISFLI